MRLGERRIAEHIKKAEDFRRNPTVRPGMERMTEEAIRAQHAARIRHLETEIRTFKANIEKAKGAAAMNNHFRDYRADGRLLRVVDFPEASGALDGLRSGFVALVPADSCTRENWLDVLKAIVAAGSREVCFFGRHSAALHAEFDGYLESSCLSEVVTSEDETYEDAAEHVVYGACAGECDILALVSGVPGAQFTVVEKLAEKYQPSKLS